MQIGYKLASEAFGPSDGPAPALEGAQVRNAAPARGEDPRVAGADRPVRLDDPRRHRHDRRHRVRGRRRCSAPDPGARSGARGAAARLRAAARLDQPRDLRRPGVHARPGREGPRPQRDVRLLRRLTAQRRKSPQNDIISKLLAERIDGEPLSWEDLAAYYFVLVGAGNETTRNLLTGAVMAFADFPPAWEHLGADRSLMRPAVEETIRYITPTRAMRRTATRDVEWHGRTIRTGDKVVLWFQSANRDPEKFDDPDTFRLDRRPNPHVGFGWGIHMCMAMHLARAEAIAFFSQALDRGLRVTPIAEPDRLHTNQFHAFKRLRVRVEA